MKTSVDDQAEWLDDNHILYALGRRPAGDHRLDIWVATLTAARCPETLRAPSPVVR
jgi:hypothetical protein